jgi:hypothetical protein
MALSVLHNWDRYRRLARLDGRHASLSGFATYQRQYWGAANLRELLAILSRKGGQVLRHSAWNPRARKWRGEPLPRRRPGGPAEPRRVPQVTILRR